MVTEQLIVVPPSRGGHSAERIRTEPPGRQDYSWGLDASRELTALLVRKSQELARFLDAECVVDTSSRTGGRSVLGRPQRTAPRHLLVAVRFMSKAARPNPRLAAAIPPYLLRHRPKKNGSSTIRTPFDERATPTAFELTAPTGLTTEH